VAMWKFGILWLSIYNNLANSGGLCRLYFLARAVSPVIQNSILNLNLFYGNYI
jgi:hypothetical protein